MPPKKPLTPETLKQLALLRSDPRVAQMVEDGLVLRLPQRKILQKLEEKYGITESIGRRFVRSVLKQWEKQQAKVSSTRKAHMRATLEAFYAQCMADRKYLAAFQALRELIRLDGLAEPERLKVDVSSMSVEMAVSYIEDAHDVIALAKSRGVIETTATPVPIAEPDNGSDGGGETH